MKLEDMNETVFQALSPEVQTALIEANQVDPIVAIAVVLLVLIPMLLLR